MVNHDGQVLADVLIKDRLILAVGLQLEVPPGTRVIDASGSYVMPGGIDPHTHLSMPFMGQISCEDFFRWVLGVLKPYTLNLTLPTLKSGILAGLL